MSTVMRHSTVLHYHKYVLQRIFSMYEVRFHSSVVFHNDIMPCCHSFDWINQMDKHVNCSSQENR
jgi:hypothetical protein